MNITVVTFSDFNIFHYALIYFALCGFSERNNDLVAPGVNSAKISKRNQTIVMEMML